LTTSTHLLRTISERANRPRADFCFAIAEQSSEEPAPVQLLLVHGESLSGAWGSPAFVRQRELAVSHWQPSAGRSPSPCGLAVSLGCVIVSGARVQVRMNARREAL
jgi:hypothetical protein